MGQRGDHLGTGTEPSGYERDEREERESLVQLATVMREDEEAEARAWANRLVLGGSFRDISAGVVVHHVGKLLAGIRFLEAENAALRKSNTERSNRLTREIKTLKSKVTKMNDKVRNLLRYRTDGMDKSA